MRNNAKESYSINDLTIIGREEFRLNDDWHCFSVELIDNNKLKYGLAQKDNDGNWISYKEFFGVVYLN